MKSLSLLMIILLTSFEWKEHTVIIGKTVFKDTKEAMSGVEIYFPNEDIRTISNADRNFYITVPRKDKYQRIDFAYYGQLLVIQLLSVSIKEEDTLNLGNIEMILNKSISTG